MRNKSNSSPALFSPETKLGRITDKLIFPVGLCVIYIICDLILGGGVLLEGSAFMTLISHTVIPTFIAWGLVFIFSGGPDFSIAGAMVLAGNLGAAAVVEWNLGYVGLFVCCILTTVVLQLLSTWVRLKFNLPTWVSGLAMLMIYEAIGAVYTQARTSQGMTVVTLGAEQCRALGSQPWPAIFLIAGTIIVHLIFSRTKIGIDYRAASNNAKVAGYMGIKSKKTQYIAALVGAVLVGIAAVLTISSSGKLNTFTGLGSMGVIGKALATWLLAGAMEKRLSKPICIVLGAFFTAMLFNVMTRLGVPSGTWQEVTNAAFILIFGASAFAGTKEVVK